MSCRYLHLVQILSGLLSIQSSREFICPRDGRWPHPADCEKFYTCNSGFGVEAWCGNGMTYDIEHTRCDLAKNIDCKNGERPSWIPPLEWQTKSIAENLMLKTTSRISSEEKQTEWQQTVTMKPTSRRSSKLPLSRILLPNIVLTENSPCIFQGNLPDQDNCQSYFTCKDAAITRFLCPDKHLFDEDLRSCNDYRKVFCANRRVHEHENGPCTGQPNGWYPEHGNQCRSYYLCTDQRQTKMDECPIGTKWNPQRLRCDNPRYIAAPCGYHANHTSPSLGHHCYYLILLVLTFSFSLLTF